MIMPSKERLGLINVFIPLFLIKDCFLCYCIKNHSIIHLNLNRPKKYVSYSTKCMKHCKKNQIKSLFWLLFAEKFDALCMDKELGEGGGF